MASRLSDSLSQQQQIPALLWAEPGKMAQGLVESVDLESLALDQDAAQLIQAIAPQRLYFAIKDRGIEASLDVLRHLSDEQFVRILDYDAWRTDRLRPKAAMEWLHPLHKLGTTALFERFRTLDEEYQISILQNYISYYDAEEVEQLSDEKRGELQALPGEEAFYEVKSEDPKVISFVSDLVASTLAGNLDYCFSLLAHSAYAVPSEPEHLLGQFRKARLEEDGFIPFEESISAFAPIDFAPIKKRWQRDAGVEGLQQHVERRGAFLDEVLAKLSEEEVGDVQFRLMFVANNLCSATRVQAEDIRALANVLHQTRVLVSVGLEFLAEGDAVLAGEILREEHPKVLLRTSLTLVRLVQEKILNLLDGFEGVNDIRRSWLQLRSEETVRLLEENLSEKTSIVLMESLRGFFNRLPMRPVFKEDDSGVARVSFDVINNLAELNDTAVVIGSLLKETH